MFPNKYHFIYCVFIISVTCPSNPPPANRVTLSNTPPSPALVGSTLSFSCNGQTVSATCENDGQWSPNPSTYQCLPRKVYSLSLLLLAHSSQLLLVVLLLYHPEEVLTSMGNQLPSHWVQRLNIAVSRDCFRLMKGAAVVPMWRVGESGWGILGA